MIQVILLQWLLAASAPDAGPAPQGSAYRIERHTIDAGAATSSGSGFEIRATIGQPDAEAPLVGGDFALRGGFWTETWTPMEPDGAIFSDGFE